MHNLYRYVCILNVFFICVYGQLSAIKNLYRPTITIMLYMYVCVMTMMQPLS